LPVCGSSASRRSSPQHGVPTWSNLLARANAKRLVVMYSSSQFLAESVGDPPVYPTLFGFGTSTSLGSPPHSTRSPVAASPAFFGCRPMAPARAPATCSETPPSQTPAAGIVTVRTTGGDSQQAVVARTPEGNRGPTGGWSRGSPPPTGS
jgi:hypothetical protein